MAILSAIVFINTPAYCFRLLRLRRLTLNSFRCSIRFIWFRELRLRCLLGLKTFLELFTRSFLDALVFLDSRGRRTPHSMALSLSTSPFLFGHLCVHRACHSCACTGANVVPLVVCSTSRSFCKAKYCSTSCFSLFVCCCYLKLII